MQNFGNPYILWITFFFIYLMNNIFFNLKMVMGCISDCIRAKHGEETEIEIIYEDQPCNDFNSLFLLSQGWWQTMLCLFYYGNIHHVCICILFNEMNRTRWWQVQSVLIIWRLVCQTLVARTGVCNYIPQILCIGCNDLSRPWHYDDVRMGAIASQITSLAIVYSTVNSDAYQRNIKDPRHWPLCGEFTGTGEFPAQRASYAENVFIWWRHHGYRGCHKHVSRTVWCNYFYPVI